MIEIHIDLNKLAAVALFAAQKSPRPQLNGVYVEATASATRLAATDAANMALHGRALPEDFENKGCAWEILVLPPDLVAKCKPQKSTVSQIGTVLIERVGHDDTKHYIMRLWDGTLIPFEPVKGEYYDVRRIIPRIDEATLVAAQMHPDALDAFAKAAKLLGDKERRMFVSHSGPGKPMRVSLKDPDFIGITMPSKMTCEPSNATWPAKGPDHG